MLHILNKRFDTDHAARLLRVMDEEDDVVLIEQAVQVSLEPGWSGFSQYPGRIHLLSEDLVSRGLREVAERHALSVIDMDEFLTLTRRHAQSVTW